MFKLRAATDEQSFRNVWTVVGKILYKVDDTPDKPAAYYQWRVCNGSLNYAEKKFVWPGKFCFDFVFFYVGVFRRN